MTLVSFNANGRMMDRMAIYEAHLSIIRKRYQYTIRNTPV